MGPGIAAFPAVSPRRSCIAVVRASRSPPRTVDTRPSPLGWRRLCVGAFLPGRSLGPATRCLVVRLVSPADSATLYSPLFSDWRSDVYRRDDLRERPDETVRLVPRTRRRQLRGPPRRSRRLPRAERRRQVDDDAHPHLLHLADGRDGEGARTRRVRRAARGAAQDRLPAAARARSTRR